MSAVLVDLIRAAGGKPMTVGQLTQEVLCRRVPTSSNKPRKLIENRVYEMLKRGTLRRAPNGTGFVLGKTSTTTVQRSGKPGTRNGKASPARTGAASGS
jgi:hypothetical protein